MAHLKAGIASAVIASLWGLLPCTLAAEPAAPAIHLLAPAVQSEEYDQLIAETSLRLVAGELAARQGIYARYWPVDQLDKVPADAYPRLELVCKPAPKGGAYYRLSRRGNLFVYENSVDGKEYHRLGQAKVEMPAKAFVGLFQGAAQNRSEPTKVVIRDVTLNGQAFSEYQEEQIGKMNKPATAERDGSTWTLGAYGCETAGDYRERGLFLYRPVEGDFTIEGVVEEPSPKGIAVNAGLMCRGGLDMGAPMAAVTRWTDGHAGNARYEPFLGVQAIDFQCEYQLSAVLRLGPDQSKPLADVWVSTFTWDELTGSVERLSDQVQKALATELQWKWSAPQLAKALPDQLASLQAARTLALEAKSGKVLEASRQIDAVLNKDPTCPQAHYAAAVCGAMLPCQELYGRFQRRDRYLAGPLSHWLLARHLAGQGGPSDKLAQAWVMLVCGYPADAVETVKSLSPAEQDSPEARAIAMFATRDYRPLTQKTALAATGIEQLAWLWALQQCGRMGEVEDTASTLASKARSAAFLPLYGPSNVGPGHALSTEGLKLAFARDAYDLLVCPDIPEAQRREIGARLAAAIDAKPDDAIPQLARNVAWTVADERGDDSLPVPAIQALMELYQAALDASPAPVSVVDGRTEWRSIPIHDAAELQRGLFFLAAYVRAQFMGEMWGVSADAREFCRTVAAGTEKVPGIPEFFRLAGALYINNDPEAKKAASDMTKTPLGNSMAVKGAVLLGLPRKPFLSQEALHVQRAYWRGSYGWASECKVAFKNGYNADAYSSAMKALAVDPFESSALRNLIWMTRSTQLAEPYYEHMQYNLAQLRELAWYSSQYGQLDKAAEHYNKLIDASPQEVTSYLDLANMYILAGQRQKAIEVGIRATENCSYSVGLSNLMGDMAVWLVQENRPKEALKWGKKGAGSYSSKGLLGLATALNANGQKNEAFEVYRAHTRRYQTEGKAFMSFLLQNDYPESTIIKEVEACIGSSHNPSIAESFAWGVIVYGEPELLEKLYEGPFSFINKATRDQMLFWAAFYARSFDKAAEYGLRLAGERKDLTAEELIQIHEALRMAKRTEELKGIEERIQKLDPKGLGTHIRFLLGQASVEQMMAENLNPYYQAYAYWLRGMDWERQGDLKKACELYRQAVACNTDSTPQWIPSRWTRILWYMQQESQTQPTTASQPSEEQKAQ